VKIVIRIDEVRDENKSETILSMTSSDPKVIAGALRSVADKYDPSGKGPVHR
jgi:hypothetical protein